ncbi:MAG: DUF1697 domain-containing protein [Halobacteriota archaeon]
MRCVVLLRGINVAGRKTVNMPDLKKAIESVSFKNVETYAQSGNVLFDCKRVESHTIAQCIEERVSEIFGVSSRAIVRTQRELEQVVDNNPLVNRASVKPDKLYVTFLSDTPDDIVTSRLDVPLGKGEMFAIVGKEVYLYCPNGYARTKLNNAAFEAKLKTVATTRNWKTVNKLLTLSELN